MNRERLTDDRERRAGELMSLVGWQVGFGKRYPGSDDHVRFREALQEELTRLCDRLWIQRFSLLLRSHMVECSNFIGKLDGDEGRCDGPALLGTHFDTRMIADQEMSDELRMQPIPGANDGGSGTAVLLHLLDLLRESRPAGDTLFAFFDAEDVGDIEGYKYGLGAEVFASDPVPEMPKQVVILDMIGGRNMHPNIDRHIDHHPSSRRFTTELWEMARDLGIRAFSADETSKRKFIVCDHTPFMIRSIPTCVLIDIDYPEWHTLRDLPEAMSGSSMAAIEELILRWLTGPQ